MGVVWVQIGINEELGVLPRLLVHLDRFIIESIVSVIIVNMRQSLLALKIKCELLKGLLTDP